METLAEALDHARAAYGRLTGVGETVEDEWQYVGDLSRVWLVAQLSESDASKVQLGDEVVVTTPAIPGAQFHARIDNIGAQLDPNTHRLPVRATVDNPGNQLKPQMFASFAIRRQLGGAPGALVPAWMPLVPLGMYWRTRPMVFSQVPRWLGRYGSAEKIEQPSAVAICGYLANCGPLSKVIERTVCPLKASMVALPIASEVADSLGWRMMMKRLVRSTKVKV